MPDLKTHEVAPIELWRDQLGVPLDPLTDRTAYPRLTDTEMIEVAPFGDRACFPTGETLFAAGEYPFSSFTILSGKVRIVDVSTGERIVFVRYGGGYFTGDLELFTLRPSVVTCEAEENVEAIRMSPRQLRHLFVRKPALGERYWRAFQRRRELILSSHFRGLSVYGHKDDKHTIEIIELLFRNMVPHTWIDTAQEENAREVFELREDVQTFPVIAYGKRVLFEGPSRAQLAEYLHLRRGPSDRVYDVLILGAGPSGLGAAVYAASEGLSTVVLDELGPGGQAGSSSRIENYPGFPDGISGRDLAHLTYLQALKFGAEFHVPGTVIDFVRRTDGLYRARTSEGDYVLGKTVVIATGVSYGQLPIDGLRALHGAGVYHSATNVEVQLCRGSAVHVVGAGNSAGQAAMYLSQHACEVSLLVRGNSLRKMSSYLSERLLANERVRIRYTSELASVEGSNHIEEVRVRRRDGGITREQTAGLFIFVGTEPKTAFLPNSIARDGAGYVLTGPEVARLPIWRENRSPCSLETSLPGVFACGDCRGGTTKRVAFAIGDGALAVTSIHGYLGRINQVAADSGSIET